MAGPRPSLTREMLRAHLRAQAFRDGPRDLVGAEVELIPWMAADGRVDVPGALRASDRLWASWPGADGWGDTEAIPWRGGRLTREPGGQWEFSGPPLDSPEETACATTRAVAILREQAATHGFDFLAAGLHPWADTDAIGLHRRSRRYEAMQAYFDTIGPAGRRMMRLTGSVQVTVDFVPGAVRRERWELAQRLAPVLTAAFANSAVAGGQPASSPCLRARTWLGLDPKRTGIPRSFLDDPGADPVDQYLAFALAAPVMFVAREDSPYEVPSEPTPFATWMESGLPAGYPDLGDWEMHLSTLFPDVRPRGYLEVRAMDAPGIAWLGVPILVVGHGFRDATARRELLELLRPLHGILPDLRVRAADRALGDPKLRGLAAELFTIVRRTLVGAAEELVAAYDERYIQQGLTPGEELRACIPPDDGLAPDHLLALEAERQAIASRAGAPHALSC
jgi:glutamate--cysteine ligase